jgi:FkbM family methyltransferase
MENVSMSALLKDFVTELNGWANRKVVSPYPTVSRKEVEQCGIIVYGGSIIGRGVVAQLIDSGIIPAWIVDKNIDLHGTRYMGIEIRPVASLSELDKKRGGHYVLLASTHINEMRHECERLGVRKWILTWCIREFCPMVGQWGISMTEELRTDGLVHGIELFEDEKSHMIYKAFVKYHYVYDNDFSRIRDPIEYFPSDLLERIDYSRFVDCGAFVGDTLKIWQKQYLSHDAGDDNYEYWAFEPNEDSFEELKNYVINLNGEMQRKIHLFNAGLAAFDTTISMTGNGVGASVKANNTGKTSLRTIDGVLQDATPTVIKADVEGYELELLKGAEKIIRRCHPTLMISVYHKFSDIYVIPQYIAGLGLGYELYLRHAPTAFTDTTLYAIMP